jgi:lactoylglutathione lyase
VNPAKGFESCFLGFADGARLEAMTTTTLPLVEITPGAQRLGLTHLAISVGSERLVDELTARLRTDGIAIVDGPRRTGDGYYESVIIDPDGNRVEICASTEARTTDPTALEKPMTDRNSFRNFGEFYPFYLGEHANRTCRRLHFAGTSIAAALLISATVMHSGWLIAVAIGQGYAFAWVGHFFFEHNKPATFKHPLFSLMGDWRLWWDILSRKVRF